jgi:hypothetical protein
MKNLRTHMWICFTLGVFLLTGLIVMYFAIIGISDFSDIAVTMAKVMKAWIINLGLYMTYFLIVLFKAIKYTPSKA